MFAVGRVVRIELCMAGILPEAPSLSHGLVVAGRPLRLSTRSGVFTPKLAPIPSVVGLY